MNWIVDPNTKKAQSSRRTYAPFQFTQCPDAAYTCWGPFWCPSSYG